MQHRHARKHLEGEPPSSKQITAWTNHVPIRQSLLSRRTQVHVNVQELVNEVLITRVHRCIANTTKEIGRTTRLNQHARLPLRTPNQTAHRTLLSKLSETLRHQGRNILGYEQPCTYGHLKEDATDRPDINGLAEVGSAHEHLDGSIRQCAIEDASLLDVRIAPLGAIL